MNFTSLWVCVKPHVDILCGERNTHGHSTSDPVCYVERKHIALIHSGETTNLCVVRDREKSQLDQLSMCVARHRVFHYKFQQHLYYYIYHHIRILLKTL